MLGSTYTADVALPNLAFALIMRTVQQSPAVSSQSVSHENGTRASTPLASSRPAHHVDMRV
jgi:hypothetical protein